MTSRRGRIGVAGWRLVRRWFTEILLEAWRSGLLLGLALGLVLLCFAPGDWMYKAFAMVFATVLMFVAATYRRRKGLSKKASESDLLSEYRERAEAWSSHPGGRAADRLLAEQAVYARRIVQTVEGRLALEGLVSTGSPGAQLLAAHAVYAWNRPLAAAAMERLASDEHVDPIVRSYAKNLRQDLKRQFESRPGD